ncbi:MGS207 protein [Colletotrichum higginsianum]|uniref:MGS207 protein n=1 Tax=Colletotrichum higginsianum (strain IMI 349063) TaxID=759273 RepID=H1UW81_COLHI|nr:MGS207 protein [Colletotrichum higginsianum IMI 349063]OBR16267.1 MGS207 protein [Colletotrichum higginsianum IMI 349063]CCF32232.1 MGS207 protein [Colletotrichum higginsianum]
MASTLEPVQVHLLHERDDPSSQKLKELFHRNHTAHAVLHNPRLILHNHLPHALGSSYLLGATDVQLEAIYLSDSRTLTAANADKLHREKITTENWRDFLGNKIYTVAYAQFFDSEVEKRGGDWVSVVEDYLFTGPRPVINGFIGGLGHSFIHLAYAFEFNDKEVATEALSLGCTEYDPTHEFLDSAPPDNSTYKTPQLEQVLRKIRADDRFDGYANEPGFVNILTLLAHHEAQVLEHWNAWVVEDPIKQLGDFAHTAATLFMETCNAEGEYDFYLAHILTVAHALRVLFPHFSLERQVSLMRQYGLYAVLVYLAQLRPETEWKESKASGDEVTPSWDKIYKSALDNKWFVDVHFPKVVRGLKVVEETWGLADGLYQRAAATFVAKFNGWGGFGLGVDAIP